MLKRLNGLTGLAAMVTCFILVVSNCVALAYFCGQISQRIESLSDVVEVGRDARIKLTEKVEAIDVRTERLETKIDIHVASDKPNG